jgi:hypothetical protein
MKAVSVCTFWNDIAGRLHSVDTKTPEGECLRGASTELDSADTSDAHAITT